MARYMVLYEVDTSRTPEDPKAKKAQLLGFDELVVKNLKEGVIKDFGIFAGERNGYIIFEGSGVDLYALTTMWVPFVKFTAREIITVDEANKANKALPE